MPPSSSIMPTVHAVRDFAIIGAGFINIKSSAIATCKWALITDRVFIGSTMYTA